jgi:hypothetical protein
MMRIWTKDESLPLSRCRGEGRIRLPARRISSGRLAVGALTLLLTMGPAGLAAAVTAEEFDIMIPLDTRVTAPEGSVTVLATESIAPEFAAQICSVSATAENETSVHPDNDLIVESGNSTVLVEDVESGTGSVVHAGGDIELGSEIVVSLLMGPDGVFSAGLVVHVDCTAGLTTTTTQATTTTTTATTTTTNSQVEPTTTTGPEETTTTIEDEVLGTVNTSSTVGDLEELPFTGPHDDLWVMVAGSLPAIGVILLIGSRRQED